MNNFKLWLKALIHWHKFTTLLIYSPHNQMCNKPQCAENDTYGFLLRCDCGYTKLTKLPYTIIEILEVRSEHNKAVNE